MSFQEDETIADKEKKKAKSSAADAKGGGEDDGAKAKGKENEDAADAAESKKSLSPIMLIVAALVSFVVFLAIFSYTMGVFDPKPEATEDTAETQAEAAEGEDAAGSDALSPEVDGYYSEFGRAAAEVEAVQKANAVDTMAELSLLERRQREIAAEEAAIAKKRRELEVLRGQIEELLVKKEGIAKEKVAYIAKLLDGMKQEEMAGLMTNLDNDVILSVLPSMKPQTASRVLALLPPQRAAKITTQLLKSNDEVKVP